MKVGFVYLDIVRGSFRRKHRYQAQCILSYFFGIFSCFQMSIT